jgi:hypothetical protein
MNTRNGQTSPSVTAQERKPKGKTDEKKIDSILSLADYEVEIDPYRGLTNTSVSSPWFQCRQKGSNNGNVFHACGYACPSLNDWSKRCNEKRKNKISEGYSLRIGRRPQECMPGLKCDFNPVSSMSSLTA